MSLDTGNTLYVGGEWRKGSGPENDVINPATEETIATVRSATPQEVAMALEVARAAQTSWVRVPSPDRGAALRRIADVVVQHLDELARLLVAEVGKPLEQALGEVEWAVKYLRYTAEWDRRIEGDIVPSDSVDESIHLLRVPLGVVAAICPWNFPIALFFRKVAPALVTGNTIVLKPSEVTPMTSVRLTQLIHDSATLPHGVLGLVTGGRETGRALVTNPMTDMVTMTGHRDSGKAIMADAAANLTRVSLELGGKAPAIVCRDADIDAAVDALVNARHTNAGQVCTCPERVLVDTSVHDEFVHKYVSAVQNLRLGDPLTDVDIGPLVNAPQLAKAQNAIQVAQSEGAELVTGGTRPDGATFGRGYWLSPTVFTNVTPEMPIMREEVFGPVTPIMSVDSLAEAFSIANDSRYGLSAYVFTSDYRTAMKAASDVAFGEIYINRTHGEAVQAHHIGHRESGLGGEDGKYGVLKYTQLRTVYHYYGAG
jgi:lactaldehyde dehydrogenase / glycolaldehyde dehydrogenase